MTDATARQAVLVTGGAGFIGARLVRRLIEHHERVLCLVRRGSGASSRIDELRSMGAEVITGDVTDRESVERAVAASPVATVLHLAGLVRARNAAEFMRVNEGGVEAVAAACAARTRPPVLVIVSSLAAAGTSVGDRMRSEEDAPSPVSAYGRSKLAGEQAAARYAGAVPITIVRPPVVFGPGDRAVLEMFRSVARWGVCPVPGREGALERRLSLIHVDDLIDGLLLAAEKGERLSAPASPTYGQGIYFVSGEDHPTFAQLGEAIASAVGRKPPTFVRIPGPLLRALGIGGDIIGRLRGRPVWINSDKVTEALAGSWVCSPAKGRAQLGCRVAAPLTDRLRETVEWYGQAGWL